MHVMVLIPSARGVHPQTMSCVFNMRTVLERAGHHLHLATLYRMPLDMARNELAAAFVHTKADVALWLDDDVQIEPMHEPSIMPMIKAIEGGASIVSAPCRLRAHDGEAGWTPFNVRPVTGDSVELGGTRPFECSWTGLGAVAVHRRVFEKLFADATLEIKACVTCGHQARHAYASRVTQGKPAVDIFCSEVVPAKWHNPQAPDDANVLVLDDFAFSRKARMAGFIIHAAIDVPTCHDGMLGCFGEELEKHTRAQKATKPALLGADGRKL